MIAVVSLLLVSCHAQRGPAVRPTLDSRIKGATLGALVADALSLGTHYEYDAHRIAKFYGSFIGARYYAPGERTGGETHGVGWGARNFHNGNGVGPPKKAGENTDYGDYVMLILEHLAATAAPARAEISLEELIPRWQLAMKTWRSWKCTQSRQTLQQVERGERDYAKLGGHSNAMSLRFPAALGYFETEESTVDAALTSMFTHQNEDARAGAAFFARVAYRVVHGGLRPRDAIDEVAAFSSIFIKQKVAQAIAKVKEATDPATALSREEFVDDLALTSMARLWDVDRDGGRVIKVGKASPTEGTLPGSLYFILKYENDLAAAASANAAVGGDNASRSIAIGMVLGGALGVEAIPARLGKGELAVWDRAMELLNALPLTGQRRRSEL